MGDIVECQDCGGLGWTAGMGCCGGSDWECGAQGCFGPIQVQECCRTCGGSGGFPMEPAALKQQPD